MSVILEFLIELAPKLAIFSIDEDLLSSNRV